MKELQIEYKKNKKYILGFAFWQGHRAWNICPKMTDKYNMQSASGNLKIIFFCVRTITDTVLNL